MTRRKVHRVAVLVFDGVKMLDVAGPVEVFAEANMDDQRYEISLVSADGGPVRASNGIAVSVDGAAQAQADADVEAGAHTQRYDTVLVAGGDELPRRVPPEVIASARTLAGAAGRVASICTGSFILAATGLLDGRRATTHWRHVQTLGRRYPGTTVEPDALYVRDGQVYTSAGVTAGIDLALALLEEDFGADLARSVARSLVVYMQRAGGQSQFSALLRGPVPRTSALRLVADHVKANPTEAHTTASLASVAHVSPRHLTRMFAEELGVSPHRYLEQVRFDLAKALLDAGHSVTEVASAAGFPSYESLRRAFLRNISLSPSRYQKRFATARRS